LGHVLARALEKEPPHGVFSLVEKGNRTALRAVLTAPTYLTGLNEEHLALLRD
jgi:hypothetical protein